MMTHDNMITYDDLSQVVKGESNFWFLSKTNFKWKTVLKNDTPENMSEHRLRTTRSRFTAWWDWNYGMNQLLPGSTSLSSLYASITSDWHVSGATDRMLLTLPFSSIVHRLGGSRTLVLSHNESLNIMVTDRQKDGQRQTYGRTDVHQDGDPSPLVAKTAGCPRHRVPHWRTALGKLGQDLCVQCLSSDQITLTFHMVHYFE